MRLLAVQRRVEVGAAGEHEPIEQVEQLGASRRTGGIAIGSPPARSTDAEYAAGTTTLRTSVHCPNATGTS